jgi:hypothetical protein
MRKIEQEMNRALRNRETLWKANTSVSYDTDGLAIVRLHGNIIAYETEACWFVSLSGWNTPTTRSRLNALAQVIGEPGWLGVFQKDFQAYLSFSYCEPVAIDPDTIAPVGK